MKLKMEDLLVTSFTTATTSVDREGLITVGTDTPDCIVYVSDCVSCPPDA